MNSYDSGDVVRVAVTFTNQSGTAVDPGAVALKVKNPLGVITIYNYPADGVIKDSTGNYHFDFDLTVQGKWVYRWQGTVSNKGAEENSFQVRESAFD